MRSRARMLCIGFALLVVAQASIALAEIVSGTVISVSSAGDRIVIKQRSTGTNRTVRLSTGVRVSVDGKSVSVTSLRSGQAVSAFVTDGSATRLVVKSGDGDSTTPEPKPAPEPKKETPRPTPVPKKTPEPKPAEPMPEPKPMPEPRPDRTPRTTRPMPQAAAEVAVQDWPQFRGANRDNISRETGLLASWPEDGPAVAWTARGFGEGYSSVSISRGRVLSMGNVDDGEYLIAVDLQNGREVWKTRTGRPFREGAGNGPRSTPTIDGDRVYALGANGDLVCANFETGRIEWQRNILQDFGGSNIQWGICESVLIDGEKLICTPGGRRATMVALNKNTGSDLWLAQVPTSPSAAYSSPIAVEVGGVRQYVNYTQGGVVGVRARDGMVMWGQRESANGTANCSTALFEDNAVFTSSGYGTGGALFRLASRNGVTASQVAYTTREMENHHGGMVALNGHLYGSSDPGILRCIDMNSGRVKWQNRSVGKGSLTLADGHLYVRSEGGAVALVEASPDSYNEKGRFEPQRRAGRPAWAHPVVADGKLFLRDQDTLTVFDIKAR